MDCSFLPISTLPKPPNFSKTLPSTKNINKKTKNRNMIYSLEILVKVNVPQKMYSATTLGIHRDTLSQLNLKDGSSQSTSLALFSTCTLRLYLWSTSFWFSNKYINFPFLYMITCAIFLFWHPLFSIILPTSYPSPKMKKR